MSTYAYETASVAVFIWAIIIGSFVIHLGDPPSSNNIRPPIEHTVVQVAPRNISSSSSTTIMADVTAYSPWETCPKGVRETCVTASGKPPVEGRTFACPRNIPLGTRIGVDGQDFFCEDRTAKRFDGRFDQFVNDWKKAKQIGITQKEIIIYGDILRN